MHYLRKSEPEKRSMKDESGLKDIKSFFTCTARKAKKSSECKGNNNVKNNYVIEID